MLKNNSDSIERKFTILKLEIRPLTGTDIVILAAYGLAIAIHFYLISLNPAKRILGLSSISLVTSFITCTTPLGLRFRNIYFFAIWLFLCLLFIYTGSTISLAPVSSFLLYQVIRLLFRIRHHREFIPYQVIRGEISWRPSKWWPTLERYTSKVEGRGGDREDKHYMKWLAALGYTLFIICLYGAVGIPALSYSDPFYWLPF